MPSMDLSNAKLGHIRGGSRRDARRGGDVLHEKGLQRQIGVATLVSSQKRSALFVPLINRWSNAGQPLIVFLRRF